MNNRQKQVFRCLSPWNSIEEEVKKEKLRKRESDKINGKKTKMGRDRKKQRKRWEGKRKIKRKEKEVRDKERKRDKEKCRKNERKEETEKQTVRKRKRERKRILNLQWVYRSVYFISETVGRIQIKSGIKNLY
jgi:hypothetical protein